MHRPLFYPLLLLALAGPLAAAERVFDFANAKLGEAPPGFRSTVSGTGPVGDWKVILDEVPGLLPPISPKAPAPAKRPVLAQVSRDRTDERFPLLMLEDEIIEDFSLTTRFKLVDGVEEQMAGIAFRIQDEKNYYYVRASGLGGTFNFFKIVAGVRSPAIGAKVEIARGVWHEMTIECKGNQIRAWLNGKELFPALGDTSFKEGKIGFWTKSDSVSYFSDVRLNYKPKVTLAQILIRDAMTKYPRLVGLKIFAASANQPEPRIIASADPKELGHPGRAEVRDAVARGTVYYGKDAGSVLVTLPLHDSNGETVAAVKVVMKSFPGQTEKNAIARALPIVKEMEGRVRSLDDLTQ